MYDTLRKRISELAWVPRRNLVVAISVWWSCSWRTSVAIMVFMLVAIPVSPLVLWPFGLDVEKRFTLVRTLGALLVIPIHVYFLARAFGEKHAGCDLVIQDGDGVRKP